MILIFVFGTLKCSHCIHLLSDVLRDIAPLYKLSIFFVDGDSLSQLIQLFCDLHDVTIYPHVKIISDKLIIFDKAGDDATADAIILTLNKIK